MKNIITSYIRLEKYAYVCPVAEMNEEVCFQFADSRGGFSIPYTEYTSLDAR